MARIELSDQERETLALAIDIARSSQYEHERRQLLDSIGGAASLDDLRDKIAPPPAVTTHSYDDITITTTAGALLDKGVWREACDLLGINEWAVNEGQMERTHQIELTTDQAKQLGFF